MGTAKNVLIRTDWVSPARAITGQDHLAVQAVSEHVYSALLPGITNVTDRVRYYTFYPWFVWTFDRLSKKKDAAELVRMFRRAECLNTLIAAVHGIEAGDEWAHGATMIGRDTLVSIANDLIAGKTIRLSQYASLDDTDSRYFKHALGGLGQYYLGPLKDLGVLDGGAADGLRYTTEWGATLATAFDATVDAQAFFAALNADRVDRKTVMALEAFCPCRLRRNKAERDAIVDLILGRGTGPLKQDFGSERRATLALVLSHTRAIQGAKDHRADVSEFLASCYTGLLPAGAVWKTPVAFEAVRTGWGIYQRHELLGIAVQGLFWAGLEELGKEGGHVLDAAEYASWFAKRFQTALGAHFASTSFKKLVSERASILPSHAKWQAKKHELSLGDALMAAYKERETEDVVRCAIEILLSLASRGVEDAPYADLVTSDGFFETYEINLSSFRRHAATTWLPLTGREWLEWLATSWGIRAHFRVALRKLRHQIQDTFRIVPAEDGLRVREAPAPQWTSPRLGNAYRFLYDLGALEYQKGIKDDPPYCLSQYGEQLLETLLGQA